MKRWTGEQLVAWPVGQFLTLAASWCPIRVVASRCEGRIALPCATDDQLVRVGHGVCALPNGTGSLRCEATSRPEVAPRGRRPCKRRAGEHTAESAGEPGPDWTLWVMWHDLRLRAKRTENIWVKSLTLDVSRLSGWLNADASCRVARRAYDAGRGIRAGRRRAAGDGS